MRVTITIDEEKVFQAESMAADEGDVMTTSGELPGEAKPMSAGGPPVWLLQELEGGTAGEPHPAQTPLEPMDAGPAPPSGNGPASIEGYFGR
jgi:hypothetical protein